MLTAPNPSPHSTLVGPASIARPPTPRRTLPVYRAQAGFPSPATDYLEDGLDLNEYLVANAPASFLFTMQGNSMIHAGILHGDRLVVDRSITPIHRDLVVAVVDGEFLLRRLIRQRGQVALQAEDGKTPSLEISEEAGLQVWGVVNAVVRRCR